MKNEKMNLFENLQNLHEAEEREKLELKLLEEQEDDDLSDEEVQEILDFIKKHENEPTYTDEEMAKELGLDEI